MSALKRFGRWWIGAGALLLSLANLDAQVCSLTLEGVVLEAETGEPLPFATIAVQNSSIGTMADENGRYRLDSLCQGEYVLVCSHVSCHHIEHRLVVPAGEQTIRQDFVLTDKALQLESVLVRAKAIAPPAVQAETTVDAASLGAARGLSLSQALERLPGVNSFKTGATIAKPVIQGLRGNRVLLYNNGVRLEGQQWGDDHAPEIDPFQAGEVRVVRGAAGVRYGAGALGGVVLLDPPALPREAGIRGALQLGGYSNGSTGLASGHLESRLGKTPFSWRLQGTAKAGGNVQTPDYYLENTGLREYQYSYTVGYRTDRLRMELFYSRFLNRLGIFAASHIGNLTDLKLAIERGRPLTNGAFTYELGRPQQRVTHELVQLHGEYDLLDAGKLSWRLNRQFNRRQEFDAHRPFGDLPDNFDDPQVELELTTYQGEVTYAHPAWQNLRGEAGLQGTLQRNTTDRGALLPDYRNGNLSVFLIERWRRYPSPLEIEAGLRYDRQWLQPDVVEDDGLSWEGRFQNVSATLGGIYHASDALDLRLHYGRAWRAPHANELFSDGVHHGSAAYERGDAGLRPEVANQLTAGFDLETERLRLNLSAYAQFIDDFIYLTPQPEPVLTIRGAFPAFQYVQTDSRLLGLTADADWKLTDHWQLEARASLLRARDLDREEWLIYMPADRFSSGVRYNFGDADRPDRPFVALSAEHVLRQSRVPEGRDFAAPPDAYTLFNLEAGADLKIGRQPLTVSLSVFNLLDTRYRDYLDRFRYFADAPGRNLSLNVRLPFGPRTNE